MCRGATPTSSNLTPTYENICDLAREVGFDACGLAPVRRLDADAAFMDGWVAAGLHGNMDYLERNCDKRYNPAALVPEAKTVVVCLLTYAHSGRDYHRTVKSHLYNLQARLTEQFGADLISPDHQHIFCDSAPVLERRWCVEAGLGFIGRNRQLIHPTLGSMVHPGELVLNVSVPAPTRPVFAGCGDCRRCLDACPTGALRNPVWDARLCIAYTTHYCLVCQNNCPYNETVT